MYEKSHTGGLPQEEIKNFLLDKSEYVTYFELPFHYALVRRSYLTFYRKGKVISKLQSPIINGPEWFQYIFHIVITYYYLVKTIYRYDLCIAMDNLTALPIIPLRKFGIIKKLIYYSIDYTPIRFKNYFLNTIYQFTNKIASRNADVNWAVSKAIVSEKRKRGILGTKKCIIVPVGFRGKDIVLQNYTKVDKYHLIFVGILLEKQGLQLVLSSLSKLIKKNKEFKMTVIGTGEYEKSLYTLSKKLKLDKHVNFTGFIKDHHAIEDMLTRAGIGLAPYKPVPGNFTTYADPGKIKLYLGCGLPVITTAVPQIAGEIKKNGCGEVIKYKNSDFINAVTKILINHKKYREAALQMRANFDYNLIYKVAFEKSNNIIAS